MLLFFLSARKAEFFVNDQNFQASRAENKDNMHPFFQKHKLHLAALAALLAFTAGAGYAAFVKPVLPVDKERPRKESDDTKNILTEINNPPYQVGQGRSSKETALQPVQTPPAPPEGGEDESNSLNPAAKTLREKRTITATITVQGKNYPLTISEYSTAYDLMISAKNQRLITLHATPYGDLGYMIDELNGLKNSSGEKKYWIYYINGKKATIGISSYVIHEGDIIEWKYEDSE